MSLYSLVKWSGLSSFKPKEYSIDGKVFLSLLNTPNASLLSLQSLIGIQMVSLQHGLKPTLTALRCTNGTFDLSFRQKNGCTLYLPTSLI
jgi:hypothetical protein